MINYLLVIFIFTASAQPDTKTITVEGLVTKFDDKTIQLKQANGAVIIVPRAAKQKMQGIKLGKDNLKVNVSPTDFLKLNSKYFEEKK